MIKFKLIAQIFIMLLPWIIRRPILAKVLGCRLASSVRIGLSIIDAKDVQIGENCFIGHLNVFRNLDVLRMEDFSAIGNLNSVAGFPAGRSDYFNDFPTRKSELSLGAHSSITSRHLIDCTDSVDIGAYATIAGYRSQILTHSIDIEHSRQTCGPVVVGGYSFIATGCIILKGVRVASHTVAAAGSVIPGDIIHSHSLIGGVPARPIRTLDEHHLYFQRATGDVS